MLGKCIFTKKLVYNPGFMNVVEGKKLVIEIYGAVSEIH